MTNLILGLLLTALPDCSGRWESFSDTGYLLGSGSNACYSGQLIFHTQTNLQYRVLLRTIDTTSGKWGVWNYYSRWFPGSGSVTNFAFNSPEPSFALLSVEVR